MDISALGGVAIGRGTILHSDKFEDIDHGKLFVIMGEDEENCYGFFFINSEIDRMIQNKKILFDMQLPLKRLNYKDILKYDSFLDCHELSYISKPKLLAEFQSGEVQRRGSLADSDLEIVLDVVRESTLFSEYEKETVFK